MDLSDLRARREELAHRKSRLILNNDGCDCHKSVDLGVERPGRIEEFLGRRFAGDRNIEGLVHPEIGVVDSLISVLDLGLIVGTLSPIPVRFIHSGQPGTVFDV